MKAYADDTAIESSAVVSGPVYTTTESGLKYTDIKIGEGASPIPGDTVRVHYTGWLDGFESEKKFDSSYDRRSPLVFKVGVRQVIAGWDEALLTNMKVGTKRNVIIPPELGYGSRGAGGVIPPDIYLPLNSMKDENKTKRYPVILFVSGGAWVIGYKMWSALIARGLSRLGAIVVCPDYRNAPQGDIECMMDDITNAIKWTINNIDKYNGDRNNIIVAGQSAGYSHTDPILEGPLMGENRLLHDMMRVIRNNDCDIDSDHDIDKPLVPKWLVQAAKRINPF
eukprot:gene19057-24879_t